MKNIVENIVVENIQKYKYVAILIIIIFILFAALGYSSKITEYDLYVDETRQELKYGILVNNNEQYIHIDDLTNIFKDNIYYDKISAKLILTTYDKLIKIDINSDELFVKNDGDRYCNLTKVISQIGYNVLQSKDNIYVINIPESKGEVVKNRTELFSKSGKQVLCYLTQGTSVNVDGKSHKKHNMVNVVVNVDNVIYYGEVFKENLEYSFSETQSQENPKKVVLVKAENQLYNSTDVKNIDMVAINMYRLSGVSSLTKLDYINNVPESISMIATINNGAKLSNYDQDIVSGMLNSEYNRQEIIKQIEKNTVNLSGVNLEFSNLKISDQTNYTQFIKELSAVLHGNNKIVVVSLQNTKYVDIESVIQYIDYVVIQPYNERTIASKTSGPISSMNYVENIICDISQKAKNVDKIILEVPAYTILWTERKGTVINAEQYTMKALQAYINENNIQSKFDKMSGQNHINYTKGITTYKMWLEDMYSISEKTKLAKKYSLGGVSIYRSGMELTTIYAEINKILNESEGGIDEIKIRK